MSNTTNAFIDGVESELKSTKTLTENGALAYETSGKALVDINFAVSELRGATKEDIEKKFSAAFFENPVLAVKWLFFARDVRKGMGERRLFRICMKWLAGIRPAATKKLLGLAAEYGRWDDIVFLIEDENVCDEVINVISKQWESDRESMKARKPISLLAKWMPSITTSSRETVRLARRLAQRLGLDERTYRKTLSSMRKHLNVLEQKMSAKQWSEIDYEAVPSKANLKYNAAFFRNDEKRRREFLAKLEKGEAKINSSTNYPHDILHKYTSGWKLGPIDPAIEALWRALPDYVSNVDNGGLICVADGSGSMTSHVSGGSCTALEVANALAIYFSEKLTGPFKDKYITFSERPQLINMGNATSLHDKAEIMLRNNECASTNIEAVFDLMLKTAIKNNLEQKDIPNILILSDMNFNHGVYIDNDEGDDVTLMESIAKKWEAHGYNLPQITYWNICGGFGRTAPVPVQRAKSGVALVSGFSPSICSMIYSSKIDPFDVLVDAINVERYAPVEEAVKGLI